MRHDKRSLVYLAGPISHTSYNDSVEWRKYATQRLDELGYGRIGCLSPMRAKEFIRDIDPDSIKDSYKHPLATRRGIMTRDRFDVMRSDALLVNLLGTEKVTIGTMIELGWADIQRKPVILVMEPNNIHDHAMVTEAAGYIVPTLEEGIILTASVLLE